MKKMLCATDLSPRSDRAIRRAFRLASRQDAKLTILNVVDSELPVGMAEVLRADAKTRLERYAADMAVQFPCSYEVQAVLGDPATDLAAIAREADVDLVILGLHRHRRILDRLSSTTMERVVRATHLPVLLVRDPADHDYRVVLAPVDFSPAATAALHQARALSPQAQIVAFYVLHIPFARFARTDHGGPAEDAYLREATAEMEAWATKGGLPAEIERPEIIEGGLREILLQQLHHMKPDLVAIGAHARSGFAPFILGNFATSLVRDPPCDLLVTRPPKADGPTSSS